MKKIKKFFIRLLCIFIPSKKFRMYIRECVLFRYFKAKYLMRNEYKFSDEIAIIAMIRNESDYLVEWIDYHHLIGVSKFYIFDNESTDNTSVILQPYINSGLVVYEYLSDKKIEELKPIYKEYIKYHVAHWLGFEKCKQSAKWVAIIDIDEFIVPKQDKNLHEFLSRFDGDVSQIILGWNIFGSNGHIKKPYGLVTENYTMCGQGSNGMDAGNNFKAIINPRSVVLDCNHYFHVVGHTVNEAGRSEKIWETFNQIMPTDICAINHYVVKSYNECQRKMLNNKSIHDCRYNKKYFNKFDVNDIEDKSIFKFVPDLKKVMKI